MEREKLRRMLQEHIRQEKGESPAVLKDDLSLRDGLGLDSIDLVAMVIGVQEQLGVELKTEELEKTVNIGNLLDLLLAKVAAERAAA